MELALDASGYGFVSNIESSISFKIDGDCVNTQCDIFYGFGDGNQYFNIFVARDGGATADSGITGKDLFIYPPCGSTLVTGDVRALLNNSTVNTASEAVYDDSIRSALSENDKQNWDVWKASLDTKFPMTIEIINDDRNGEVTVLFINYAGSIQSCSFIGTFTSDKDLYFNAINDKSATKLEALRIYDIDITTSNTPVVTMDANSVDSFISIQTATGTMVAPSVPKWRLEASSDSSWYVILGCSYFYMLCIPCVHTIS